jgi:Leucine-rich repeat (LRR) protein
MSLSLSGNAIADLKPLAGLTGLYHLFLEDNRIRDLSPLVNAVKRDAEGEKRFAPFLNLYLKGNRVKAAQVQALEQYGVRVHR